MDDDLDTSLVEFAVPYKNKDDLGSPAREFERFLAGQKRSFAVEEYILPRAEFSEQEAWAEWFANHPDTDRAFVAVFFIEKKNKPYFDALFAEFMERKRKRQNDGDIQPEN